MTVMDEVKPAVEIVRMLAGTYARLLQGETTDREAHADAVVLRDRLQKIVDARPVKGRMGGKVFVVDGGHDRYFGQQEKRYSIQRPGAGAVLVDTMEEVNAILGQTGIPDSESIDQMEAGVVRRRLRGIIGETAAKRELFIIKTLKEAIDAAGGIMPEVLFFNISFAVTETVDPSEPKRQPFKCTYTP